MTRFVFETELKLHGEQSLSCRPYRPLLALVAQATALSAIVSRIGFHDTRRFPVRRRDVICSLSRPAVALDGPRRSAWHPTTLVFSLALAGLGCKGVIGTADTGGPVGSGSTSGSGSGSGTG